jgi:hypothetical protein
MVFLRTKLDLKKPYFLVLIHEMRTIFDRTCWVVDLHHWFLAKSTATIHWNLAMAEWWSPNFWLPCEHDIKEYSQLDKVHRNWMKSGFVLPYLKMLLQTQHRLFHWNGHAKFSCQLLKELCTLSSHLQAFIPFCFFVSRSRTPSSLPVRMSMATRLSNAITFSGIFSTKY